MGATTIRVDSKTHARLVASSNGSGASLIETVRDGAEALSRQRSANRVVAEPSELRQDPEAWAAYLAKADETTVGDGVG